MEWVWVGTGDGLMALQVSDDDQDVRLQHFLRGCDVVSVHAHPEGDVFAATLGDGLWRLSREASGDYGATRAARDILPTKLRAVAGNPLDLSDLYVGAQPTGIYRSTDLGRTWDRNISLDKLSDQRKWKYPVPSVPPHIRHIQVSPFTPGRVWAAVQVGGVLRSDDHGETWTDFSEGFDPDVHMIQEVARDVLVVATGGGGWPSLDPYPPAPPRGKPVYKSTDAGESWQVISPPISQTYGISIWISPATPQHMAIGLASGTPGRWAQRAEGAMGVLAVTHDGGSTWRTESQGLPRSFTAMPEAIAGSRRNPAVVYVGTGGGGRTGQTGELYRSKDNGESWTQLPAQLPPISAIEVV